MNDIEKLLAIEEIKAVKAKYFRYIDTKNWAGFEGIFCADYVLDVSDDLPGCITTGAAKVAEMVRTSLADVVTVHHGHCPEIELTSDTTATGIWAMEDILRFPEDSPKPIRSLHGFGHYHETYERIDGRWYLKSSKLRRLRVDIEPKA